MGMDALSYLVLDNIKSWSNFTPNFCKLFRAKGHSILITVWNAQQGQYLWASRGL